MNFTQFVTLMEYGSLVLPDKMPEWPSDALDRIPAPDFPHSDVMGMALPAVHKSSRIDILIKEKNPIYVQLADGSKMFFSLDEYKRIKGTPEVGKTMTVVFQRHGHDKSNMPSLIKSAQCS